MNKSKSSTISTKVTRFLSSKKWAGIAGIAAILGVVIALISLSKSEKPSPILKEPQNKTIIDDSQGPLHEVRIYLPSDLNQEDIFVNGSKVIPTQRSLTFSVIEIKTGLQTLQIGKDGQCKQDIHVSQTGQSFFPCRM